jgi:hypothetical protein
MREGQYCEKTFIMDFGGSCSFNAEFLALTNYSLWNSSNVNSHWKMAGARLLWRDK